MHPYSTTQLPKSSPHPPYLPQVTFLSSLPFQSDPSVPSPWNCCLFWSQCIIPEGLWGFRVMCEWVMLADEWREEDRIGWRDRWEDGLGPGCLLQEERGRSKDISMRIPWSKESLPRAEASGLIISPALDTKGEKHEVNLVSLFWWRFFF